MNLLKERHELYYGLPHLYGRKFYKWQRDFYETTKREVFLSAANQIGKSSIQIIKNITLATDKTKWKKFWPKHPEPHQFWYLMPTAEMYDLEATEKWEREFMPRGDFKKDKVYGWKREDFRGTILAYHFESGVSIYFKSYMKSLAALQAGTVWMISTDEELPVSLWPELTARRNGVDGVFSMVWTSTLGEQMWHDTMELIGQPGEKFKGAFKRIVSLHDCKKFEDGSKSHWTQNRINKAIANCQNEAEVKRRIYGRAVKSTGLIFPTFSSTVNVCRPYNIDGWIKYAGIDPGAGGDNHPSAIAFVAIRPDYQRIAVYKGKRFDNIVTTHGDIFNEFIKMRGEDHITMQLYDAHCVDFRIIAERAGETFVPADKDRKRGIELLNTLFRFKMIDIFDIDELTPLVYEIQSLSIDTHKSIAKDDFIDATRYAISRLNFDYSSVKVEVAKTKEELATERDGLRSRKRLSQEQVERMKDWDAADNEKDIDAELAFWDNLTG